MVLREGLHRAGAGRVAAHGGGGVGMRPMVLEMRMGMLRLLVMGRVESMLRVRRLIIYKRLLLRAAEMIRRGGEGAMVQPAHILGSLGDARAHHRYRPSVMCRRNRARRRSINFLQLSEREMMGAGATSWRLNSSSRCVERIAIGLPWEGQDRKERKKKG